MKKIYVATTNPHKIEEITEILGSLPLSVSSVSNLCSLTEVTENGTTFAANAAKKAGFYARRSGGAVIADDSGLEVASLNSEPGVHSARYAGPECDYQKNNEHLIRKLHEKDLTRSPAAFRCVIALQYPDDRPPVFFEGSCRGEIIDTPRGENGFGYDPLFVPEQRDKTFAEMTSTEKNRMSHRYNALLKFKEYVENEIIQ